MALVCSLAFAAPAHAAPPDLKADIDSLIQRIEGASRGMLQWDGAEKIDVHQDGTASVADIVNARILVVGPPPPPHPPAPSAEPPKPPAPVARVLLDRIEVRRAPAADGALDLSIALPKAATISATDNPAAEASVTLDNAIIRAVVDAESERARELTASFAGGRVDDKTSGGWVTFGPLAGSYKLTTATDGSWKAPGNSELKNIAFFFPKGPLGGSIDRVTTETHAAGPDLAAANRLRDRLNAMQQNDLPPAARGRAFLALLPDFLAAYSDSAAKFAVEGITVHKDDTAPLFSLKKAGIDLSLSGMSGDKAALRITLKHDDLSVAASVPNAGRIPRRGVVDLGLENVSTAALRKIIDAALKASDSAATPPERQAGNQQMMSAVMTLTPTLRLYDLAFDVQDAGVEATGKSEGWPMSPAGYAADADIAVRNFAALKDLLADAPAAAAYLPVLKEIGTTAPAGSGAPETKFHLASAPGKWITLNGDDVSAWFAGRPPGPGEPHPLLRPSTPPPGGDDVRAVQHALADAKIEAPQNGVYDGDTAAAVARFQKANNLNVNGVVDAATRQKLGIKTDAAPKKGPN